MRWCWPTLLALWVVSAIAPDAQAQAEPKSTTPEGAQADGTTAARQPPQDVIAVLDPLDPDKGPSHNWALGRPRWFAAGIFDFGFLYLRPRLSVGYGKPHSTWLGLDVNPLFSGEGGGAYLGLRGALPAVDLRVGGRFFHTFERSFLCPTAGFERAERCQDEPMVEYYDREDIESRVGPQSIYFTLESELTASVPVGPGNLGGEFAVSYVTGIDDGYFVYEETIKVVLDPPWVLRGRVSYDVPLDLEQAIHLGVVAEVVRIMGRELYVVRAGFTGSVRLYNDLEARGIFIPVLDAQDDLGAAGGDTFLLGVRYRWATR